MTTIKTQEKFILKFTESFLNKFYGSTNFFNIENIAESATPAIIKRIKHFKKYVKSDSELVDYVLGGARLEMWLIISFLIDIRNNIN